MSILFIDSGNTRLKWGHHDGEGWVAQGVTTFDRLGGLPLPGMIQRIVACNVAGEAARYAIESLGLPVTWAYAQTQGGGVVNSYEDPSQLGSDRWMALMAARARHDGPCLVVMSGTATTADVLDATGRFCGGVILPGLDMMRRSLTEGTAALSAETGIWCEWPTNTRDAIETGCLAATLGAIQTLFAAMAQESDALCLLSGGAASTLASRLDLPHRVVNNLVLEGLRYYVAAQ